MSARATPWIALSASRAMAFSTGMRLGALVAIAGCASAALRKGAASSPMDRLVVLVLSAFVASALWGLCAGLWLRSGASRRFAALERLVESSGILATKWCAASARDARGALGHGALVLDESGAWSVLFNDGSAPIALGREAPTLGTKGLGWGAALLGAACEPLEFHGQIVYVDRAYAVLREEKSR
jgi:hypothetical protein